MFNWFEKAALFDRFFLTILSKNALWKENIVFVTCWTNSLSDSADHFAEIARQMIVLGMIKKF